MAKETKTINVASINKTTRKDIVADLVAIYHNVESALKFVEEYARYSDGVKADVKGNKQLHANISYVAKYLKRMEAALSGVSDKFRTSMLKEGNVEGLSDNDLAFVWSKLNEGSSNPEYKFEGIDETKLFETLLARDEYKDGAAPESAFGVTEEVFKQKQKVGDAEYPSIEEELTLLLNDSTSVDPSFERELKGDSALEINKKSYSVFANGLSARGRDAEGAATGFGMFIRGLDNDVKHLADINKMNAVIAQLNIEKLENTNKIEAVKKFMYALGIEFVEKDSKTIIREKLTGAEFDDFDAYHVARILPRKAAASSRIGFDKLDMLRKNGILLGDPDADGFVNVVRVKKPGSTWNNINQRYEDKKGNVAETEYDTIAEAVNARYTPLSENKIIRLAQKFPKSALAIALAGGLAISSLGLGLGLGIPLGQKSAQLDETRNEFNTYREDLKYMTEFFNGLIAENAETSEKAGELTPDELVQLRMIAEKKGEPTSDATGVSKVSFDFANLTVTPLASNYTEESQYYSVEELQTLYAPVKRIIESEVADEASSLASTMISIDKLNDYTFVGGDASLVDFLKEVYPAIADAQSGKFEGASLNVLKGFESTVLKNNYEKFGLTKETDQNGNTVYKDKDGKTVTTIADALKGYSDIVKEYADLEQDIKDNYLSKDEVNNDYYSKDYVDQNYTANDVYNAMKEEKDKLVEYTTQLKKLQDKYLKILQNGNLSDEDKAIYAGLLKDAKEIEDEINQKYKDDFANALDLAGNYENFDALYQSLLNDYNLLLSNQNDPDLAQKYAKYKAVADVVDTLIKKFSDALSDKTLTSEEKKDIENDIAKLKQLQGAVNKYGSNYGIAENVENALSSVEGIISDAEANANTLQGEIDKLEGQISTLTSEKNALQTEKNALQTEYDNFKKNHNHTDAEYKALGDKVSGLTADLAAKDEEFQNKINEYSNLVAKYNALLSQKEAAENALNDYKKTHSHTDSEYNSLQSKVTELNGKVSSMSQQLDEQYNDLEEYAKKVVDLENEIEKIIAESLENRAFMEQMYKNLTGNECGGMTDDELRAALAQLMEFDFEFNPNQNGNGDENTNRPTAPEHGG